MHVIRPNIRFGDVYRVEYKTQPGTESITSPTQMSKQQRRIEREKVKAAREIKKKIKQSLHKACRFFTASDGHQYVAFNGRRGDHYNWFVIEMRQITEKFIRDSKSFMTGVQANAVSNLDFAIEDLADLMAGEVHGIIQVDGSEIVLPENHK